MTEKLARRAYKLGAWMFVGIFLGHTIGQLVTDFGAKPLAREVIFKALDSTTGMEGSSHSMLDFMRGNSYGMGFMFLATGAILLLAARVFDGRDEPYPRAITGAGFVTALGALLLSLRFFPVPPIVFMTISASAFAFSYIRTPAR